MGDVPQENCATAEEIKRGAGDGSLLVVDVRTPQEIEASGKIESKRWLNIPIAEVTTAFELDNAAFKEKYGLDKPNCDGSDLIFNCGSGRRSAMAINKVLTLKYTKSRHFPGGYGSWK